MNIKAIAKQAIRACITESDIKEAIYIIVSDHLDLEAALAESETLQDIVYDALEEAVEEEISDNA